MTGEWRTLGEEALAGLRAAMARVEDPVLHAAAETLYADLEWQVETGDRVLEEAERALRGGSGEGGEGRAEAAGGEAASAASGIAGR